MKLRDLRNKLRSVEETMLIPTEAARAPRTRALDDEGACCPFAMSGGICGRESPLTDADEVDVGVGVIKGNHVWTCPEHGDWSISRDGHAMFRDHETGLPGPSGEVKVKAPLVCDACGGLGTIEEDDGHAGRYGGRIVDCKKCGGTGSPSTALPIPATYPGTPEPIKFGDMEVEGLGTGSPARAVMEVVERELLKRGIKTEDVAKVELHRSLETDDHADITFGSGKVMRLPMGVDIKILPSKGVPKNTIVITGGASSAGPKSMAAIYAAEAMMRELEKGR